MQMWKIDSARWPRLSATLDELLDQEADAREARLVQLSLDDPQLAKDLRALLARRSSADRQRFLDGSAIDRPDTMLSGVTVGAYTLERPLGSGGTSSVWLAKRSDGRYEGQAAIKFLNLALLDQGGAERLRREATALAKLAHPGIARLFDAGVSAGGQPYLVLEHIDGAPIDRWCDARGLGVRGRVRLVLDVLAAVGHAHDKLVLHRDLKPNNTLVGEDGCVKLLDFGIAKLLDDGARAMETVGLTESAGCPFTPDYAAPEQVEGGDVTPATDIYAVGVLLYVLLTETHPTIRPTHTRVERLRSIVEAVPPLPSAAARGGRARELCGELDRMVSKALSKSPTERYPTAHAFADDLRRYLATESDTPQAASAPPGTWAPRSASPARASGANNLPVNLPSLIGRERDVEIVRELLSGRHLVTLVGAGGVGKTRLALEVARAASSAFKDGIWFVELAPVADAAVTPNAVAAALDVHEEPGRTLQETLLDFLRHRELLIVLDNCEHLIEACAQWADTVLRSCSATRILATSREALDVAGELVWPLPCLSAADPKTNPSDKQLMTYAATQLFMQRATTAFPSFRLTQENAAAVAQICHQLDGIPLALELAAARASAMRVEQIAERLHDRFALLARGRRTALQRHQTLRSLIDWSYDLLCNSERVVLRRLSVFAGGWTPAAAELVCSCEDVPGSEVLQWLTKLVEKSLVVLDYEAAEPRYRMLETIRQYGLDKLLGSGEADAVKARHIAYFCGFAEDVCPKLSSTEQLRWHARVDVELDNIRVALNWSMELDEVECSFRLITALHRYWYKNLHWKEIVDWQNRLSQFHRQRRRADTVHLARSFYVAGMLATNFDPALGRNLCEQCLQSSTRIGFAEGKAWALMWIGFIDTRQRADRTGELFAQSVGLAEHIEDPWRRSFLLVNCLICYANYEALMGRDDSAETLVRRCEQEAVRIGGDPIYIGHCRALLGTMAIRRGELERAHQLVNESLSLHRAVDSSFDVAWVLSQQGLLALKQGDPGHALELLKQCLPLHRNYPMSPWVTKGLAHLLLAYAACEQWQIAARLAGVLNQAGREPCGHPPELSGRVARAYGEAVARIRAMLGEESFRAESELGRRLTREQAIDLALSA